MSDSNVGILVVAYNAASTLGWVLDRIPGDFRSRVGAVLVSDDHSADDTQAVGLEYAGTSDLPLTVVRQPENLGYGGNQQFGYRWMIDKGLDAVVLLHGDGQYAPEEIERLVAPILDGEADVVLGSRMMDPGGARAGGMPAYKYVGNRILTTVQNRLTGLDLTEWHSGYRAFRTEALASIPFEANSAGFDFDTEVLLQFLASDARIVEVPIPTYYGDEICHVDGVRYARDVVVDVGRFRLARMGFGTPHAGTGPDDYEWKPDEGSSHRRLAEVVGARSAGRVLDLGCGTGQLGDELRRAGHHVVGVDVADTGAAARLDGFVVADLDAGLPDEVGQAGPFDVVVAADVLEHVRRPEVLLDQLREVVGPGGVVVASIPNFAHWYPRARVAAGRFDYDARGILDRDHVRFFTRRSFERLVAASGWTVTDVEAVGLPFDVADRGAADSGASSALRRWVGAVDRATVRAWPSLFAYQYLMTLAPR